MSDVKLTKAQLIGRAQFERVLMRRVSGLDYLPSPAPTEGASPRTQLIANGTLGLFRYTPRVERRHAIPLMLVMSTGHRGYVADLAAGQSLVEHLLDDGFDVFMLEWGPSKGDENYLKLENYVLDFLPRCASRVRKESGAESLSVIGVRNGGLFSLIWASLNAERGPRNLVCMATPYDWNRMPMFRPWADREIFDVDKLIERFGGAPLDVFDLLHDLDEEVDVGDTVQLWRTVWNSPHRHATNMYVRWMCDLMPQPGELFRQFVKRLLWENRLMRGSLEVGGRHADVGRVTVPFLQVYATGDRLIPAASARPLLAAVGGTDKSEIVVPGGHADLFMGAVRETMWPALSSWLAERSE